MALAGEANAGNSKPVSVNGAVMLGAGTTGPLAVEDAEVVPAPVLSSEGMSFMSDSLVSLAIVKDGSSAGADYSQLLSNGSVNLGGARLSVEVRPAAKAQACPTLVGGQTYTLLSTTAALNGTFGNAPDGEDVPVYLGAGCLGKGWSLQIAYHRSEATKTVSGTVVESSGEGMAAPENPLGAGEVSPIEPPWSAATFNDLEKGRAIERQQQEEREAREKAQRSQLPEIMTERIGVDGNVPPSKATYVQLDGIVLQVRHGYAEARLRCVGERRCMGTITVNVIARKRGGRRRRGPRVIATGRFSVAAHRTGAVKLKLDRLGLRLLSDTHGKLSAQSRDCFRQGHLRTFGIKDGAPRG